MTLKCADRVSVASDGSYDVVIIGSGVGGGAVALKLAGSKAKVLILEREVIRHLPSLVEVLRVPVELVDHALDGRAA